MWLPAESPDMFALFVLWLHHHRSFASLLDQAIAALKQDRYPEALAKLGPLATMGDSKAQYLLGYMCALGLGRPRNSEEAIKWFRRSSGCVVADYGKVAKAASDVARAFLDGSEGAPRDDGEAVNWLKIASENGSQEAADRLSRAYSEGLLGLPRDPQQAEYWRRKVK